MAREDTPLIVGNAYDFDDSSPSSRTAPAVIPKDPEEALRKVFGYKAFRPGQQQVVSRLLEGKSVLAHFPPNSGGRRLCYQLAGIVQDGLTLVISPFSAHAEREVESLQALGLDAARLTSKMPAKELLKVYNDMRGGRINILYISHHRARNAQFQAALEGVDIALLVVDEAQLLCESGPSYLPEYVKVVELASQWNPDSLLALTVCAAPEVTQEIQQRFSIAPEDNIHVGLVRPKLKLSITPCTATERDGLLVAFLQERPLGPTIVYVWHRRSVKHLIQHLAGYNIEALGYHGDLSGLEKSLALKTFEKSGHAVIIATRAFGRVVSRDDIRYVYHYELPASLEDYWRDVAGAGKNRQEAQCELLACPEDLLRIENAVYGHSPTRDAVASLVNALFGQERVIDISPLALSKKHDIRERHVEDVLAYLEVKKLLTWAGPYFSGYRFTRTKSVREICKRFNEDQMAFLLKLFRQTKQVDDWYFLNVDEAADMMDEGSERIVKALGHLAEVGDIALQGTTVRLRYSEGAAMENADDLAQKLVDRYRAREEEELARIRAVVDLVERDKCIMERLEKFFGEIPKPCGVCSVCTDKFRGPMPKIEYPFPAEKHEGAVRRLCSENRPALAGAHQFTRFLCGVPSPAVVRVDLQHHELFGAFKEAPFQRVAGYVEECTKAPF